VLVFFQASDQSQQGHGFFCSMTFSSDVLLRSTKDLIGMAILTSFGSRHTWSHGRIGGRSMRFRTSEMQNRKSVELGNIGWQADVCVGLVCQS
jgi:hypothetical protein